MNFKFDKLLKDRRADFYKSALPADSYIDDIKLIKPIHNGGFSWVYQGIDNQAKDIIIKEFFPHKYVFRHESNLDIHKNKFELYAEAYRNFIDECYLLNLVNFNVGFPRVKGVYYLNNTMYCASFKERGFTLSYFMRVKPNYFLREDKIRYFLKLFINALDILHSQNILHLDIHPANILVNPQGKLILLDLGSARHLNDVRINNSNYNLRTVTQGFSAPELLRSELHLNFSTDIYSIGACLNALCAKHIHKYSVSLQKFVKICMNDSPILRPQSLKDMVFNEFK